MNARYTCTRACYDAKSQKIAYQNRVSTATEHSHTQLSRLRVNFKKMSSVKENNQPRAVLKFRLLPPFFTLKNNFWQVEYANAQWGYPLTISSEIALQVLRTSFRFHLRECMGSSSLPTPPPPHGWKFHVDSTKESVLKSRYGRWKTVTNHLNQNNFSSSETIIVTVT